MQLKVRNAIQFMMTGQYQTASTSKYDTDEFSEALLIGVNERFGLFVIFHWRTSNRQFIPESQKGADLTRFADVFRALRMLII